MSNPFYYSRLSTEHKGVYSEILAGIMSMSDEIAITPTSETDMSMIFEYVLLDNPLLFYTSAYDHIFYRGVIKHTFRPKYLFSKNQANNYRETVSDYLKRFDSIRSKSDEYKELYIHDHCLENFSYDKSFNASSYSIIGPILNKSAVCEGFSKFVKLSLGYLGVKCLVILGTGKNPDNEMMECHAWNIVKLRNETYHLDVTFDLCVTNTIKRYDYFNVSDEEILRDHTITSKAPKCKEKGNDYYSKNSMLVHNPRELESYIRHSLKQGNREIVFKAINTNNSEKVVNKVMQIAGEEYIKQYNKSVEIDINVNPPQMVFQIRFR